MKTINWSADNTQESESVTLQNKATYRAPRLVALGTAEGLVQFGSIGNALDSVISGGRTQRY
jgi:hypothetical protein